jgi:hypothetical protein
VVRSLHKESLIFLSIKPFKQAFVQAFIQHFVHPHSPRSPTWQIPSSPQFPGATQVLRLRKPTRQLAAPMKNWSANKSASRLAAKANAPDCAIRA